MGGVIMKYIHKNLKGIVTETVGEALFTEEHQAMEGWELVTDEEAEAAFLDNDRIRQELKAAKKADRQASKPARQAAKAAKKAEKAALKAEYEEFKAWKAAKDS